MDSADTGQSGTGSAGGLEDADVAHSPGGAHGDPGDAPAVGGADQLDLASSSTVTEVWRAGGLADHGGVGASPVEQHMLVVASHGVSAGRAHLDAPGTQEGASTDSSN